MCLLSDEQLTIVTKDVENEGINYSHLRSDLIDHVCCDVELRMDQGISFELAYEQVKTEFGIKGLRRIQQDTLMLIDKNYRIMKSSMKLIGVSALALMAFGAMFKIMHWPFAGPMLILSFMFITLVFFPALLYVVYKEVNQKKQSALFMVAFFSGLIFMAGILFKIMHWPGAGLLFIVGIALIAYLLIPMIMILRTSKLKINKMVFLTGLVSLMIFLTGMVFKIAHWPGAFVLLILGSILLVFLSIPLYYLKEVRKSEKIRPDFLFGIIAFTYFIVFSFLLSLPDYGLIDISYQDKSYQKTGDYFKNVNSNLLKESNEDLLIQLALKADLLCEETEEIKVELVKNYYQINRDNAIKFITNNNVIQELRPAYYFGSEGNINFLFTSLKTGILEFNNIYENLLIDSLQKDTQISPLLDVKDRFNSKLAKAIPWEFYYFSDIPPAETLNTLSLLQYNIRLAENIALTSLVSTNKTN